jgi:LytS/YehU family sensor histidine kinase
MHAFLVQKAGLPLSAAVTDSTVSNATLVLTVFMVAVSLHFYTPEKNTYGYLFSLCIALCLLWLFSSRFILALIWSDEPAQLSFLSQTFLLRGAVGFLFISQMTLLSLIWNNVQEQQAVDRRRTETEKLYRDAELAGLRQQLQPHFLFNSLNSINALIGLEPKQARTMIQQLSQFLRGTLRRDEKEWISLEEELAHLQLYLDIEKVRFGHRLHTEIKNETINAMLPQMVLQPVVENAIKFGLYDTTEAITISIGAWLQDNYLVVEITNPFDPETSLPQKGTGFGLRSVQRRLYLLFGHGDLLQTEKRGNLFITTMKIPQQ